MGALPVAYSLGFTFTSNKLTNSPKTVVINTFTFKIQPQRFRKRLSSSSKTHICKSQLVQDFAPVASAGYAVLLLGGGLFAYNKSGSKGSLFGGLTGATLMSVAYYLMQTPETKEIGDALAFGASLLFASIFGIRLAATRKVIPAGFLLGLSISLMAVTFSAYLQDKI